MVDDMLCVFVCSEVIQGVKVENRRTKIYKQRLPMFSTGACIISSDHFPNPAENWKLASDELSNGTCK